MQVSFKNTSGAPAVVRAGTYKDEDVLVDVL